MRESQNVDMELGDVLAVSGQERPEETFPLTSSPVNVCAPPEALQANELKTLFTSLSRLEALCATPLLHPHRPIVFLPRRTSGASEKVRRAFCCCQNRRASSGAVTKSALPVLMLCDARAFAKGEVLQEQWRSAALCGNKWILREKTKQKTAKKHLSWVCSSLFDWCLQEGTYRLPISLL